MCNGFGTCANKRGILVLMIFFLLWVLVSG